MIQFDAVPSTLAITRLVQALADSGSVAQIQELESLVKHLGKPPNLPSMIFVNSTALSHISK